MFQGDKSACAKTQKLERAREPAKDCSLFSAPHIRFCELGKGIQEGEIYNNFFLMFSSVVMPQICRTFSKSQHSSIEQSQIVYLLCS